MDVNHVNPFIDSFTSVMPQLGFSKVQMGALSAKGNAVTGSGVFIVLGIVGAIRGNAVYSISLENAKKLASTMMMGMPVEEFDELAQSAISELTNMLTANAATFFSKQDIIIDISTPTMLHGENISVSMNSDQILCVQLFADQVPIEINLCFEK